MNEIIRLLMRRDGEISMKQYESWTFPWPKKGR